MKNRRSAAWLVALGFGMGSGMCTASAHAAVVFEQLPTYTQAVFHNSNGSPTQQVIAQSFALTSSATIGQIGFWGVYYPGNVPSDTFTVSIYANNGLTPGALLSSESAIATRVDTGINMGSSDAYEYTFELSTPLAADAGETYWVGIVNPNVSGDVSEWGWITSPGSEGGTYTPNGGGTWLSFGFNYSLRLGDVVPSPASVTLAGLGGLVAVRRRR